MDTFKVSSKSNPNSVAGALAGVMKVQENATIQTVGAGALNQAIKAIAIARGFLVPIGIDIMVIPTFSDITINGEDRTAIQLHVHRRPA